MEFSVPGDNLELPTFLPLSPQYGRTGMLYCAWFLQSPFELRTVPKSLLEPRIH